MAITEWLHSVRIALIERGLYINIAVPFKWTGYIKMNKWEFFTDAETEGMDESFMAKVVAARKKTIELDPDKKGVPFRGSSWKRTLEKNQSVIGAVPDSAHLKGLAMDMRVYSSREVSIIVEACLNVGIKRIGIYVDSYWNARHIHIDDDTEKISNVIFIKLEQN